jgi:hypothetical protein
MAEGLFHRSASVIPNSKGVFIAGRGAPFRASSSDAQTLEELAAALISPTWVFLSRNSPELLREQARRTGSTVWQPAKTF